jgi:hypothetical protein
MSFTRLRQRDSRIVFRCLVARLRERALSTGIGDSRTNRCWIAWYLRYDYMVKWRGSEVVLTVMAD